MNPLTASFVCSVLKMMPVMAPRGSRYLPFRCRVKRADHNANDSRRKYGGDFFEGEMISGFISIWETELILTGSSESEMRRCTELTLSSRRNDVDFPQPVGP